MINLDAIACKTCGEKFPSIVELCGHRMLSTKCLIRGTLDHLDDEPLAFASDNFARIHASRYWLLIGHLYALLAEVERLRDYATHLRDEKRDYLRAKND